MRLSCLSARGSKISVGSMLILFLPTWLAMGGGSNPAVLSAGLDTVSEVVGPEEKECVMDTESLSSQDVLGYKIEMIDGAMKSLEDYRGSVVMFVNVASACGLTPQYEGLEKLYSEFQEDGFVMIGFPANDFGAQEPGTNEEILEFCTGKYDVTFPLAAKIHVKGKGVHPLYKQLAAQPKPIGGEPEWNFTKFLVNRKGEVVERFASRTTPEDKNLVEAIKNLLLE